MAIAPNTTFVSGAILTAAQMNALPWGVVAFGSATANDTFTTEETEITASAFTAVANRYYRITYVEPILYGAQNGVVAMRIKNGATELQKTYVMTNASYEGNGLSFVVKTFTAGSVTITGTLAVIVGTNGTAQRSATNPGQLIVEDIGPA
jgi:hypothetical protein